MLTALTVSMNIQTGVAKSGNPEELTGFQHLAFLPLPQSLTLTRNTRHPSPGTLSPSRPGLPDLAREPVKPTCSPRKGQGKAIFQEFSSPDRNQQG